MLIAFEHAYGLAAPGTAAPAPAAAGYPEETADAVMDDPGLRGADFLQAHGWLVLRFRYVPSW